MYVTIASAAVSVLFNEPKLLKFERAAKRDVAVRAVVSVLFNEPKLLKSLKSCVSAASRLSFSALQRAEIAEIVAIESHASARTRFSALQRAEIAEIDTHSHNPPYDRSFSALQRAEIAEMRSLLRSGTCAGVVSVLFNEPKLLKLISTVAESTTFLCFSALQRAEIAEIGRERRG